MSSSNEQGKDSGSGTALLAQPIVMDVGTCSIKAGFAGGSKPKVVVGTKVGRAKHMRIMPGGALEHDLSSSASASIAASTTSADRPTSIFVGSKLDEHRGAFHLDYPMDRGHVLPGGWDAMEKIYEHVYSRPNLDAKIDEHPILLTECPLNSRSNREKTAELFFETYRAPALFLSPPAVLSLYASGRTTGVVLDVGEGVTHCVPIYEGHALPHSVSRSDVAGRDVTAHLQLLLRRGGTAFTTTAEADLVKNMKERACYVAPTPPGPDGQLHGASSPAPPSLPTGSDDAKSLYQLPDGQTIHLSSERYLAPEVLFDPTLIGSEELGVADTLVRSVARSDLDLRPTLYQQVVLAGGSTCTHGFGDRLLAEVRARAPARTRIRISAPQERMHSAWAGGSILASLATFKNMWVTRAEYEEYGDSLVHRGAL